MQRARARAAAGARRDPAHARAQEENDAADARAREEMDSQWRSEQRRAVIIPITPVEWSDHWRYAAKGKATGDSGVTTDMLRLAPAGLLGSYLDIANATLSGGCIPDPWKR